MRRQHVKLTVVLVAVVLALTGFSSGSHGGKGKSKSRSSHGGGGGGCSNSKKSNGTYHDTDSDTDYGSSSGSSGSTYADPTPTATDAPKVYVFRCAQPAKGKRKAYTASTVRLTAVTAGTHTYEVDVSFLDAMGNLVDTGEATVEADGGETKTVSVRMDSPRTVARVKKCKVTAELSY
ncbi:MULTISPECIES: hypothetical protein [unclassified Streptomyces]|uniref:hypothetical protein n=1 Tax=unclassified Streptomyces TaxID=2593676 RepID=UPI000DAC59BD|nr:MULTISPECIES: hypothetical protein [unclassified Streptomyces]PZT75930.1 hypothetical protein DNK56_21285 [Streptomyces sp. AC1-42W]PZT80119.1 hypothetical protein DNK55_11400 [Streptomyces sp. AC1-42T]